MNLDITQIIIALGPPMISGFFAFMARRFACKARESAKEAKKNSDPTDLH